MVTGSRGAHQIFISARARARIDHARQFVKPLGAGDEARILSSSDEAAHRLLRPLARQRGGLFGWQSTTLSRYAGTLSALALAEAERSPSGPLALEAICARMVHHHPGQLGRFEVIADRPGLPRALSRTFDELRLAGALPSSLADEDLARLFAYYETELANARLADRAEVLRVATELVRAGREPLLGTPLLCLDVPLSCEREAAFFQALAERSPAVLLTVQEGDARTIAYAERALDMVALREPEVAATGEPEVSSSSLHRLQRNLFSPHSQVSAAGDDLLIFSAPGESRECVEIARIIHKEAAAGTPFEDMAVLLRSPGPYAYHVIEAFRRASIPAFFARGSTRPDPAGRALLALLACASEGLSARRFAEYLSLGEVPKVESDGAPPAAAPTADRWIVPDADLISSGMARAGERSNEELSPPSEGDDESAGAVRAPRKWEQIIVNSAVIGTKDRWQKRLAGWENGLLLDLQVERKGDDPSIGRIERELSALRGLREFALPILGDLESLPQRATWGEWIDRLSALATRALRRPERVLEALAELCPMSSVDRVDLTEVRWVLAPRLTELRLPPTGRCLGKVFVGSIESARGLSFPVVFVPGFAERIFPEKVLQDPILPDRGRSRCAVRLQTQADKAANERLYLRLAVGAPERRLVVSYPRIDVEQSRPRTPSFYALEVLRAAEGVLPGFDGLRERADRAMATRIGWPAPVDASQAIDDTEYDLSLLESILRLSPEESLGRARYLLKSNPHLERSLRFRARRWHRRFLPADGLVDPHELARPALAAHGLATRSFSATALQQYAACPYRFYLYAVHKLAPRKEPEALDELDPLQRGSLIHDVQFELFSALRTEELLPVTPGNLPRARVLLEAKLKEVAERYAENLHPAIDRVWQDGVAAIQADMVEWLRRCSEEPGWVPAHFELSFGLPERRDSDPRSVREAVPLACGIQLRGSIDLVEQNAQGAIRATDHKTGKARTRDGVVIGGGEVLQPILYALALEKLLPEARVDGGRLYYCTSTGDFSAVDIPLSDTGRQAAVALASALGSALEQGFLPAAPAKGACQYCDYRKVCGPYEEMRLKRKPQEKLSALRKLREIP